MCAVADVVEDREIMQLCTISSIGDTSDAGARAPIAWPARGPRGSSNRARNSRTRRTRLAIRVGPRGVMPAAEVTHAIAG